VLAGCYLFSLKESWLKAIRLTYFSHALHNGLVYSIFLLSRSLG
jgi:hypothetical protein